MRRAALALALLLASCAVWPPAGADDAGDDDAPDGDAPDDAADDDASGDDDDSTGTPDADGDGIADGQDCAPDDPTVYPGALELCDGRDGDCDGQVGDGLGGLPDERDGDADGVPLCAGDCDDGDPGTYPGASEVCDGVDRNCDLVAEEVPTGAPQEMFIHSPGHLYVTILSVDAGCAIYVAMDTPVSIPDMVGEVHLVVGTEVDVGTVPPCRSMHFTSTSCGTPFSSLDPAAYRVTQTATNLWHLEHEDGVDTDYNDVVFQALVEER